ncbi:ABC transporter ATP-binding protein/permease [Streptomyces sp. NPDC051554]|uniref:ABC transporter ATP-binding protein/permease n=1 Tax=Streptomyces sp. NPDC051554 TaxID=3365656 RepID=UPI0037BD774C
MTAPAAASDNAAADVDAVSGPAVAGVQAAAMLGADVATAVTAAAVGADAAVAPVDAVVAVDARPPVDDVSAAVGVSGVGASSAGGAVSGGAAKVLDAWQRGAARHFTVAGVLASAGSLAALGADYAVARLVGEAVRDGRAPQQCWLSLLGGALVVRAVCVAAARAVSAAGARRVTARVHRDLLDQLLCPDAPLSRPDRLGAGAAAVAVLDEADRLTPYFQRAPVVRIQASVVPLACLAAIGSVSWVCALLLALATPMVPLYGWLSGAGAASAASAHAEQSQRLSARFHEALSALPTLCGLGAVDAEAARLRAASTELAGRAMAVLRRAFVATAVLELVATVSIALVAGYIGLGLIGYLSGTPVVSLWEGLFTLLAAPAYFAPLRAWAAAHHERCDAVAATEAIRTALPTPAPAVPRPTATPSVPVGPDLAVEVVVNGLTVRYPGRDQDALTDIRVRVVPGRTLVLTGPSGAGKSTLLAALAGELGPMSGRTGSAVTWNGVDVTGIAPGQRRASVGWLRQQPYLFAGTVAANIALAVPAARPVEVAAAAGRAGLTARDLTADVSTLSGGHRQRVAIARLLLRDAPVLLLDEPTAHLDGDTEQQLLTVLRELCRGRTAVIATHSPALLGLGAVLSLDRGLARA